MLVLVRHGESALNAEGRLVGRMDPELTELGRTQAAAAGAMLGSVSEVRHSPLTRTTVTANLLGCDAPLLVEERAIEVDYGEFDGKRLEDVAPQYWRLWREAGAGVMSPALDTRISMGPAGPQLVSFNEVPSGS